MKRFRYQGKNRDGRAVSGFMDADSPEAVAVQLRTQGYFTTSVKHAPKSTTSTLFEPRGPLKPKVLGLISRQFAIELATGLSLIESIQLQEDQASDPRLVRAFQQMRLDVASGTSFTRTLEKHRDMFPQVFIYLVEAGETAGVLPEIFERLAIYYEREDDLRKKVSEALMYPTIISAVAGVMVFLMIFVVLPMLVNNFASFGVEPPRSTQIVLEGRLLLIRYWYVVAAVITGVVVGSKAYLKTERGRWQFDALALKIPVIGELQKMVIFSRFSRTLGLLLHSGISMIQSLQILGRLIGNVTVTSALEESRLGVERGEGLSAPLKQFKLFPKMLVQMVSIGEETGNLEEILVQVSDYYDREVNFAVSSFTKLLEPAVMLVLALVVLFILVSVYLPMMEMVTSI